MNKIFMAITMSRNSYGLIIGAILCVASTQFISARECKGEGTSNNVTIGFGHELVIDCMINVTCRGANSSSLYFKFLSSNNTQANIRYVSSSHLQLHISNVTLQNSGKYTCVLGNSNNIIGTPNVIVDYAPQLPTGFHCISNNQRDMNCTFNYPINHYIMPKFNIYYTIGSSKWYHCPHQEPWNQKTISCSWKEKDGQDSYKKNIYLLLFEATSELGNVSQTYCVNSTDPVRPDPVREVEIQTLDSSSLQVSWLPPAEIDNVIRDTGLNYVLVYYSNWNPGNKKEQFINKSNSTTKITSTLSDLLPHAMYKVTIGTKPSYGGYWSKATVKSGNTSIAVPKHSPVIPPGGFRMANCNSCTNIRLYWQSIEPKDQYGDLKAYDVVLNGVNHSVPYKTDIYYADINVDKTCTQNFELYARNEAGYSIFPTQFNVTDFNKLPGYPSNVALEASLDKTSVTITWNPPVSNPHGYVYKQYVIYICKKAGLNEDCASSLQYRHINASYSSVQVNVLEQYGFEVADAKIGIATAATTKGTIVYSGISWQCLYRSSTSEMAPNIEVESGVDQANVMFEPLSCEDSKARVEYYKVFYCEADSCTGTTKYRNISNWGNKVYVSLNYLVPLTKYKYWAVAVTTLGPGKVTPEDERKTFETLGLEFNCSLVDEQDPGKITFTVSNYEKSKSVWAKWTDHHGESQMKQLCIVATDSIGTMNIDCENNINGFEVHFAVYQGDCNVEKSKPLSAIKTLSVCRAPPLVGGVIALIVAAAVTVGTILAFVVYAFRKAIMKELRRLKDIGIKMPNADDTPIRRQENQDYQNFSDPYSQETVHSLNSRSITDSGHGTVSSTSSVTTNLLDTQMSETPSDVFPESLTDHYVKEVVFSDSYIDNDALDDTSGTQLVLQDYNSIVLAKNPSKQNGYAQFTMTKDDSDTRMEIMTKSGSNVMQMEFVLPEKEEPVIKPKIEEITVHVREYPHLKDPTGDKPFKDCPPCDYSQFTLPSKGVDLIQNTLSSELSKSADADSLAGFAVVNVPVNLKDTLLKAPPFDYLNSTNTIKATEKNKDPKFENGKDSKVHYEIDKVQIDSSEGYAVYGENRSKQTNYFPINTGTGTVVNKAVHVEKLSPETNLSGIAHSNSSEESLPITFQGKRDSGYMSPEYQDSFSFSLKDQHLKNLPVELNNNKKVSENDLKVPENVLQNIKPDSNEYVCILENLNEDIENEDFDITQINDVL